MESVVLFGQKKTRPRSTLNKKPWLKAITKTLGLDGLADCRHSPPLIEACVGYGNLERIL